MRVGIGYDIHGLKKGRKLVLGGVNIPSSKGLAGHSDGDALIHAIVDAIFGALGAGDIGDRFPDTDKRYKNASSVQFLIQAGKILKKNRKKIINIDSTVIAEAPRLGHYKEKMRNSIAGALGISSNQIGIKMKTNEKLDAVGRNQAIACHAVALIR